MHKQELADIMAVLQDMDQMATGALLEVPEVEVLPI